MSFLDLYFSNIVIIFFAFILDSILGDPYFLPHPVKLIGFIIALEDNIARKISKNGLGLKICGFFIVVFNVVFSFAGTFFILRFLQAYKYVYFFLSVWLSYTCIAARCLHNEAFKVKKALSKDVVLARKQLSKIVGRDTQFLSEENIVKACIETVTENTSDGVIAPILFMIFFGTAGGIAYKTVNTMDSMLGYKNEKYRNLGFFAAKFDDIVNFIPARLTAILMLLSSFFCFYKLSSIKRGIKIWLRDCRKHLSPNSAHPESVAAGLLGIQLGGVNCYGGKPVEKPFIGDNINTATISDISSVVILMYASEILLLLLYTFFILLTVPH